MSEDTDHPLVDSGWNPEWDALFPFLLPKDPSDDYMKLDRIAGLLEGVGLHSLIWADEQGDWVLIVTGRIKPEKK